MSTRDHSKDSQSFILFAGGKVQCNDTMKADNPLMFTLQIFPTEISEKRDTDDDLANAVLSYKFPGCFWTNLSENSTPAIHVSN